jgi:folate-binding protein YgfZ
MNLQTASSLEHAQSVLRTSAGSFENKAGFLTLKGSESIDLLNRLSTNDLKNLKESLVRPTILTSEKGRMIDLVLALNLGDRVLLIVGEGNEGPVMSWLEKYIIMEDITVTDVTSSYQRISIIGPQATSIASQFCHKDLSSPGESVFALGEAAGAFLYRNPEWPIEAYDIVGSPDEIVKAGGRLKEIGVFELNGGEAASGAIEPLRVELGVPRTGREIEERVNPLEAGLVRFVSFSKGCYIGQEVIARLDTYKKLQRRLRGFIFPEGYENETPGSLFVDGIESGWTTSHAHSFKAGKQIALGYLKLFPEPVAVTFVANGTEREVALSVVDLPFDFPGL